VTFDYWQTLVSVAPRRIREAQVARFAATLDAHGCAADPEALEAAFTANWERFERNWHENLGQHTPADSVDLICERLGVDHGEGMREALIEGFREVGETVHLDVAPGIATCLETLTGVGVHVGIVCDVGLTSAPTLRLRLEQAGLMGFFDAWAFSDETGWFKPAAEAFAPALEGLGSPDPSRTAHVGDNLRTDIAGALDLGMIAVHYTGMLDPQHRDSVAPPQARVLDDHRKLPGLLGIA
jgi:FMN phosphatase YigB (HAD superfamily)